MFLKFLSRLPFPVLYFISDVLSFLAFHVVRYRRKVVFSNLKGCFPEKSDREIYAIARRFYTNLSDVIIELVKSFDLDIDDIRKRVKFNQKEILNNYLNQGQPVFCMAAHQCNWEWILYGFHANFDFPADPVYKPLANKKFDKLMFENRTRFGGNPIPKDSAAREIIKRRKTPRAFALVADQSPMMPTDKYWTKFLGRDTPFYVGTEQLAGLVNAPVAFFGIRRVKRGYYEIDTIKIGEPPYEKDSNAVIERYARELEKYILQAPADWLWSHNRWKYTKEEAEGQSF